MSNLRNIVQMLVETAAEEFIGEYAPADSRDITLDFYELVIQRQNEILDRRRDTVFSNVLSLSSRGQVEQATRSFDTAYLLGLNLSLEATSDLAKELISIGRRFNVSPTKDWLDVANFNVVLAEEVKPTIYPRKVADI